MARPSQALRQRRESHRPTPARSAAVQPGGTENGTAKKNANRFVHTPKDILDKFKGCAPSLRVHLHPNHFRLNDSQDSLSYQSPMKELLQHLKDRTVPHNMLEEFYAQNVPFYDSWSLRSDAPVAPLTADRLLDC